MLICSLGLLTISLRLTGAPKSPLMVNVGTRIEYSRYISTPVVRFALCQSSKFDHVRLNVLVGDVYRTGKIGRLYRAADSAYSIDATADPRLTGVGRKADQAILPCLDFTEFQERLSGVLATRMLSAGLGDCKCLSRSWKRTPPELCRIVSSNMAAFKTLYFCFARIAQSSKPSQTAR